MNRRNVFSCGLRRAFAALIVLTAPVALAQQEPTDLKSVAKEVAKDIEKSKIASIAVADFVKQNGEDSVEGHYLAQELARSLKQRNKRLTVTEPATVSSAPSNALLSAKDLGAADQIPKISNALHADTVVTGTVEISNDRYTVHVAIRNAKDGSLLSSHDQTIKRPAHVDALVFLDPTGKIDRIARPGAEGVSVPSCSECPPPHAPDGALRAAGTGLVKMSAVIDTDGRVARAAVIGSTDSALAARAVEAVKKWRFKPALDKSGKPVAVIAPIEISFQLH